MKTLLMLMLLFPLMAEAKGGSGGGGHGGGGHPAGHAEAAHPVEAPHTPASTSSSTHWWMFGGGSQCDKTKDKNCK